MCLQRIIKGSQRLFSLPISSIISYQVLIILQIIIKGKHEGLVNRLYLYTVIMYVYYVRHHILV